MKIKTHSGAAKRFSRTGSGKIVRRKAGKRHILTSKRRNRKRRLSGTVEVDATKTLALRRLLPS
ncbi:MAG TPA: 50S ribosomal protein L35 [Nitrospiraceae bacterium]|nr:50S ribosomal protein L35 [Nitrospiraceae bacterium]